MKKIVIISLLVLFVNSLFAQDATISIPNIEVENSGKVFVPVNITTLNNVGSITLYIKYDSRILSFTGEVENNSIYGGFFSTGSKGDTIVTISWFDTSPISLDGKLFDLKFDYFGGESPLEFSFVEITNERSVPYNIVIDNGNISGITNVAPEFTKTLPDTTITEMEPLTYQYEGFDADGDNITFSIISPPDGATMSDNGLFSWTPSTPEDIVATIIVALTDQKETVYDTTKVSVLTDVDETSYNLPEQFELYQNHPNPFNPTTIIRFNTAEISWVNITIYNLIGESIVTLLNREVSAGYNEVEWNASNVPSGIYLIVAKFKSVITNSIKIITKKAVLLK